MRVMDKRTCRGAGSVAGSGLKNVPTVLIIAGCDPSGGAGVLADIKTVSALGCYGAAAVTALTVQNTRGVESVHAVSADIVGAQVAAVADDLRLDATKVGMLCNADIVCAVADFLRRSGVCAVVDTVVLSSSGRRLLDVDAVDVLRRELLPCAALVTPNLAEAALLSGVDVSGPDDMECAGRRLLDMGARAVLVKGGHCAGGRMTDVLVYRGLEGVCVRRFSAERVETRNSHGTGCALSSAAAAFLARGFVLERAVSSAKEFVWNALQGGADVNVGGGCGSMNHMFGPSELIKF